MAFYEDLTQYAYAPEFWRPGTKNVGWLDPLYGFSKSVPSKRLLDLLWDACSISVAQSRGSHQCEFCPIPNSVSALRMGKRLALGSAEIRVFGQLDIFAAPTLIYHYVYAHQYEPPEPFIMALEHGPRPPSEQYFQELRKLNLEWGDTHLQRGKPVLLGLSTDPVTKELRRVELDLHEIVDG